MIMLKRYGQNFKGENLKVEVEKVKVARKGQNQKYHNLKRKCPRKVEND